MLSLCMIVKNEESNIKNCLKQAAKFVDEIIVIDTGSSDKTKAIASEFTNKIYDFKWCNDFSKARNYSISKASYDWIIVLDADETVTNFSKINIHNFINDFSNEMKVGRINRVNILEDGLEIKKHRELVNRIFNRKYFQYEGTIHEQIVLKNGHTYETKNIDITADHLGYTKEVLNKTNKIKRNIDMLQTAIEINSKDPYLYYQLGKSYYLLKDYNAASINFEKALVFDLNYALEYVTDLVETYGYSLVNSERYFDALILENVLEIYENNPDFLFVMGIIYMNNGMFQKAIESFLECTKHSFGKVEGVTTYFPYYNIGVIYDVLGAKEKAIQFYKRCGNYKPALKRLELL